MKENSKVLKYFSVSSIVQIIISILTIVFSKAFLKEIINYYKELVIEDESFLSTLKLFEAHGKTIIILMAIITIILNVIVLYKIFKKKGFYIVNWIASIIAFISESDVIAALGLANMIVLFVNRRRKGTKEKEEYLPKIKRFKYESNKTIVGILAILIFVFLPEIISIIPAGAIVKYICLDVSLMLIMFFLFRKEVTSSFKSIKDNFKKTFKYVLKKQWIGWGIYYLSCIIVVLIKGSNTTSVNQQIAESLPMLYIIPSCIIYAPFVEELIFRGSIRRLIKNEKIFIIVSGLAFGFIHTLSETNMLDFIVLSIPYSVLGWYFAYLYVKTDNIGTSMMAHALHNTVVTIMMLFV